ncbi:uncharacterized protein LOC131936318 [Physella acuta]|uniref:uncharacterized protein LOC131936318 n=1 Tax=Physella acuta TaxID=109671 RepID=UPI0027DD9827|nr:uncharacterized protein LOC131936318 [Physella acuta]
MYDMNTIMYRRVVGLFLFACLILNSADSLQCSSSLLTNFFRRAIGKFCNVGDPGKLSSTLDVLETTILPVDVPSLHPAFTLTLVHKINGVPEKQHVLAITLDVDKLIRVVPYNVSHPDAFPNGDANLTLISTLSKDEFQCREECVALFRLIEANSFVGSWPECTGFYNGGRPSYTVGLTCNSFAVVSTLGLFPEHSSTVPYIVWSKERIPLPPNLIAEGHGENDPCNCTSRLR